MMAPLAGYTDVPFRALVHEMGSSLSFTELISAEAIVRKNKKTAKLMEITDNERPVGIQLFGKNPDTMIKAAVITEERFHPDVIDINCGCSVTKVAGSGSGAALLKSPDILSAIASGICSRIKTPVSAKIRLGWDENNKNYRDIIKLLYDSGISFITVHGRTRSQKFSGTSDWNTIAEIASFSPVPIIGNGDIHSYDEGMQRYKESGCTAVMIGRSAIGNPWIFSGHIPDLQERITLVRRHFCMMIEYYGEYGIILARKHLSHYFHGFKNACSLRASLVRAQTADEVLSILNNHTLKEELVL
jgi:tRNA-dihydrouridine synthase B